MKIPVRVVAITSLPTGDLAETEACLKSRESVGYEFVKYVLANPEGHIIWLRGDRGGMLSRPLISFFRIGFYNCR